MDKCFTNIDGPGLMEILTQFGKDLFKFLAGPTFRTTGGRSGVKKIAYRQITILNLMVASNLFAKQGRIII